MNITSQIFPDYYRWTLPLSNSEACGFEIHTETVGEVKVGDKTKELSGHWKAVLEWLTVVQSSNFPKTSRMPIILTGTQILSQTSLNLSNSVKMFIVCCPGF